MKSWKDVLILPQTTILEAMRLIDATTMQFAAVVDDNMFLLGTVTDGDIRRGILKGLSLDTAISEVMNTSPICEKEGKKSVYYKKRMRERKLKQLPLISSNNLLQRIVFSDELELTTKKVNKVVLMVGGLGTRLRPLTDTIPKPMLNVGSKPIVETIIESFKNYGFTNFVLSVNYKKEMIMDYFQDGAHLGVNIEYIEETKRLGTAGALSLLSEKPSEPFFVMNGDLLTKINFEQLLDFHAETDSTATMCVREYEYQIPYGVIETDNHQLLSIVEKPVHKSFVNAGIYVLNPEALERVPKGEFYDMPELYKRLMIEQEKVSAFPLREYWLDIGRLDDYEKANGDYGENFHFGGIKNE
ncbi:nucleotidyltransferase family protein [Psychrobacillus psychrodurans]|uniref:nucleotidyltransferase family protein n=1 Tax=Psychrobacillus psychrodurans TaxID=126157 RepID=UPI001F4DA174|nr:nucleotidyltransferase family protein [Psychrobacillus psychrodurans]MCK1995982.1 nucleotidyltransferase family protein [Psychrobacillus psychrodurans]